VRISFESFSLVFYGTTSTWTTDCLVAQDLALLTKVRTLIHEEISLFTVLYFPFRAHH
jgi:hypothetical protein